MAISPSKSVDAIADSVVADSVIEADDVSTGIGRGFAIVALEIVDASTSASNAVSPVETIHAGAWIRSQFAICPSEDRRGGKDIGI